MKHHVFYSKVKRRFSHDGQLTSFGVKREYFPKNRPPEFRHDDGDERTTEKSMGELVPLRAEEERVEKVQEEDNMELRPMRSEDQEKNEEETDKVYNLVPFRIFSTKNITFHCNDIHTRYFEVLENQ